MLQENPADGTAEKTVKTVENCDGIAEENYAEKNCATPGAVWTLVA
jgi:hypothetical protein